MRRKWIIAIALILCAGTSAVSKDKPSDVYANVPVDKKETLKVRLAEYVEANKSRDWAKLFSLVSDTARGKVNQQGFVARMTQSHQDSFSNYPDLLKFAAVRDEKADDGGFDLYGCAEAQREREKFSGIAVIHAVFEHDNWFFSGWTFDGMASGSCKELNEPHWQPLSVLKWNQPMEELK